MKNCGQFVNMVIEAKEYVVQLTNREALTVLCSVIKHAGSG